MVAATVLSLAAAGDAAALARRLEPLAAERLGDPAATVSVLELLLEKPGPADGEAAPFHYVVETDADDANLAELNEWYQQEHLPGLAAVPGTVRARRYLRTQGKPRFVACYDLVTPAAMEHPAWLAVRHTEWSSRVRPMFRNTFRTLYTRIESQPFRSAQR